MKWLVTVRNVFPSGNVMIGSKEVEAVDEAEAEVLATGEVDCLMNLRAETVPAFKQWLAQCKKTVSVVPVPQPADEAEKAKP